MNYNLILKSWSVKDYCIASVFEWSVSDENAVLLKFSVRTLSTLL